MSKKGKDDDPPDLFDYPHSPGWRDPTTSLEAAVKIAADAQTLRAKVYVFLEARPSTVHETAAALRRSVPSVQPRFSELRAQGLITETGEKRVNATSDMRVHVWRVTTQKEREIFALQNRAPQTPPTPAASEAIL